MVPGTDRTPILAEKDTRIVFNAEGDSVVVKTNGYWVIPEVYEKDSIVWHGGLLSRIDTVRLDWLEIFEEKAEKEQKGTKGNIFLKVLPNISKYEREVVIYLNRGNRRDMLVVLQEGSLIKE